jgi:L-2-hydroxyglutarate oxidase LhgO
MLAKVKAVVVGGGVIGLSVARALSVKGIECLLCERHTHIGTETSSRNSEVIHAGMYYGAGSNKARFCVAGKELMFKYLNDKRVDYSTCGKLIIAHDAAELPKLRGIQEKAVANGVLDLVMLDGAAVRALEPEVHCHAALLSPRTGIVDSHGLMQALLTDFELGAGEVDAGGMIVYNCRVTGVSCAPDGESRYHVRTNQGTIGCDILINAAGLHAVDVASVIEMYPKSRLPKSYFCKGNYFKFQPPVDPSARGPRSKPFTHLVYPIPPTAHTGLGVHSTIDMNGAVKFGPDTEWLRPPLGLSCSDRADANADSAFEFRPEGLNSSNSPSSLGDALSSSYIVDPTRCESFYAAIRRYFPGLPDDSLVPDYAGIRPKLCGPSGHLPSESVRLGQADYDSSDFFIESSRQHGLQGLVNLFGLESPALTASLGIAEHVCDLVVER